MPTSEVGAEVSQFQERVKASLPVSNETVPSIPPETLARNKISNTEDQFWVTAAAMEEELNKRGLPFKLRPKPGEPEAGILAWLTPDGFLYAFVLPDEVDIDLRYQFNVHFVEEEKVDGVWIERDSELIKANTLNILLIKAKESMGIEPVYQSIEPVEVSDDN